MFPRISHDHFAAGKLAGSLVLDNSNSYGSYGRQLRKTGNNDRMRYIVGVVLVALIAVVGYYVWDAYGARSTPPPPPPPPPAPMLQTYATSTFSIQYPSDYTLDESYTYNEFEGKPVSGVKLAVAASFTAGTNLSSDSYLSVEWLPRAQTCTGDIYIVPNVRPVDLLVGSTTYSVATTSEAAAGNQYEERVFAIKNSSPCTAVRYFIHSTNLANSQSTTSSEMDEQTAMREFDRAALLRSFDAMRDSLTLSE